MHMFIQSPCSTNANLGSSKVIPMFNHEQDAVEFDKYIKKQTAQTTKHFKCMKNVMNISVIIATFSIAQDLNTAWKNNRKIRSKFII